MIQLTKGQYVQVYYNLHKQLLSIRDKRTRKVIAHKDSVLLTDATFFVSPTGLLRVRQQKRKDVIAWVNGSIATEQLEHKWRRVYFNPFVVDSFMEGDKEIKDADHVLIVNKEIYVA